MFEFVASRPFTFPSRIVFAIPEALEMWPYYLSFCFFTMIIMHTKCILDSVANLFVRHMVFVSLLASHLKGLDPSLDFLTWD